MWKRFGVRDITMDDNDFIFISFNTEVNLTFVLDNGPCFIRNVPIFFQQWNPQKVLKKLDQEMVTMWVKLDHIPYEVYSVDGLSRIASAIGVPSIPDRLTEKMLKARDERNSFAKVFVQVKVDKDLKDSITIGVRFPFGPFKKLVYTEVDVEHEWKLASCGTCFVLVMMQIYVKVLLHKQGEVFGMQVELILLNPKDCNYIKGCLYMVLGMDGVELWDGLSKRLISWSESSIYSTLFVSYYVRMKLA
nr:hypothetical protein [Tanacetum cinerariifolium]